VTRADTRLAAALVAEHAAIYGYGVLGSHLDSATVGLAAQAEAAHRNRRDTLTLRLTGRRAPAPPAEPGYALPQPVTDQPSALRLAIGIEERTAAVWRAALIDTEGDDRMISVQALSECAVHAVKLRRAAGVTPVTVPYPGRLTS
jgi:hypothetical protein